MTSTIERLERDFKLFHDEEAILSGAPEQLNSYLLEFLKQLQEILERITDVANFGIDTSDGEAIYIGTKDLAGEYPDGTWRFIKNGDNLKRQVKILGTFEEAGTWQRPII